MDIFQHHTLELSAYWVLRTKKKNMMNTVIFTNCTLTMFSIKIIPNMKIYVKKGEIEVDDVKALDG